MISKRLGGLCAAFGLALGLGACTDDYGYGGLSVGYGNAGFIGDPYYDDFGYGGFGGAGAFGYAPSWYGWNNGFFYPGTGVYVYDQYRRPFRWNGAQQRYWSNQQRFRGRDWNGQGSWNGFDRRQQQRYWQNRGATRGEVRENWQNYRQDRRGDTQAYRQDRRGDRQAFRDGQVTPQQFRQERRDDRRSFNQELRQDRRGLRRENRRDARN